MRIIFLTFVLLISTSAFAQQQQPAASTVALQINNAVSNMALELEQSRQSILALQASVNQGKARIKELEEKYEPKAK